MEAHNSQRMREVLAEIRLLLVRVPLSIKPDIACGIINAKVKHALSARARNCDKFSKAEVLEMLDDCSFSKEDTIEWLYAEAKGEVEK